MLRGYWHILALGIAVSIISISEGHFFLLSLFFIWIALMWLLKRIKLPLVLLTFLVGVTACIFLPAKTPPPKQSSAVPTKTQDITGKIVSPLTDKDQTIEFELKTTNQSRLLITYFKDNKKDHFPSNVQHGAKCHITGEEATPAIATNPHQFDYQNYLWQTGIQSQFLIHHPGDITCENRSFLSYIYNLRHHLLDLTENTLTHGTVQWLHALVLGDDTMLDQNVIDVFQRWGLSHILAISGLHIGIVVGLIYLLFVRLQIMTKEKTQLLLCFFLPIYALVAGGQPSVWRASLMVLIVVLFTFFKRKTSYTDLVSITFILLILFNHHIIYHIGFQLSFAVTFGIILSKNWLADSKSSIEGVLKVSFVSQMVILPLQLHYFSVFDPLSILLNLLILPYFSLFVIPALFIFLLLSFFPPGIVYILETPFLFVHEAVLDIIFWVDTHLHFPFIIGELSLFFMIAYYVFFIMFMMALERKATKQAFLNGVLLCIYIVFLAVRPYLSPYGTVTMLDIGQGDAFIIELPYRKGVYFIDIGSTVSFSEFHQTDKEYRQIIQPYLHGEGIHHIDAVFLSHEHLDHYGSLPYLVDDMPVDEIVISHYYETESDQVAAWTKNNAQLTRVKPGDVVKHGHSAFQVLSPMKQTDSPDENSLVLYTEIGGLSWVFTGDIGKETEKDILETYPNIQADVLKVGHHGSDTSSDPEFVKQFGSTALISLGENNIYGHPGDEVIQTLEDAGLQIYRTDIHGAVQYRFKDKKGAFIPFLTPKNQE